MTNRERLNIMRDALGLLADASRKVDEIGASAPPEETWQAATTVRSSLGTATAILERYMQVVQREADARRARFDAVPILQAELRFRDGKTRRVAVSKPTDEIDEPHIGEMFHDALVKQGVVDTCEPWPVLVVDRRGRVVAEIPARK